MDRGERWSGGRPRHEGDRRVPWQSLRRTLCLALVAAGAEASDSALAKACAKAETCSPTTFRSDACREWVTKQFLNRGVDDRPGSRPAARRGGVGEDPEELAARWTRSRRGPGRTRSACLRRSSSLQRVAPKCRGLRAHADAWGRRPASRPTPARRCDRTLGRPVSRTVPSLIGLLVAHVGRVRDRQLLGRRRAERPREAATRAETASVLRRGSFAQSRNYDPDELRERSSRPRGASTTPSRVGSRLAVDSSSSSVR